MPGYDLTIDSKTATSLTVSFQPAADWDRYQLIISVEAEGFGAIMRKYSQNIPLSSGRVSHTFENLDQPDSTYPGYPPLSVGQRYYVTLCKPYFGDLFVPVQFDSFCWDDTYEWNGSSCVLVGPPPPPPECGLDGVVATIKSSVQIDSWTMSITGLVSGIPDPVEPLQITFKVYLGQTTQGEPQYSIAGENNTPVLLPGLLYGQWYTTIMEVVDGNGCEFTSTPKYLRVTSQCPDGTYWNGEECVDYPNSDTDNGTFPPCIEGYHWDTEIKACVPSGCSVVPARFAEAVGGRDVPPLMYGELIRSWYEHFWVLAIKPIYGNWEAYNSVDVSFSLPGYVSKNGLNPIPPLVSMPSRGVDLSSVANTLKLDTDGTDVIIVNFDEKKMRNGYYQDAEYELFRVTPSDLSKRWVASSGTMGLTQTGELSATLELLSWEDQAQKPIGDTVQFLCRHPFGRGGCRNSMLNDGPLLAEWTRIGVIIDSHNYSKFTVRLIGTSGQEDVFFSRLRDGMVYFASGENQYLKRDIKQGEWVAGNGDVIITLREMANYPPEIGDGVHVMAGCVKTPEMCKLYNNFLNYGGFPFVPLREGVMRRD